MKKIVFVAFISAIMLSNCSEDNNKENVVSLSQNEASTSKLLKVKVTLIPLTQNEISDLKFLREEEKLARDVYLYSYDKYQTNIFKSISKSEQKHMDSVLNLLDKYNIPDPASTEVGVFVNQDLQLLYEKLITQSDISLIEALKVGATIEDLDINDIGNYIANTSKPDLLSVYESLLCGSKNHLRSFTSQLTSLGVTYVPQFISLEEYNVILSSSNGGCGNN